MATGEILGLYHEWRSRNWAAHALAERPDGSPLTEQVLQLIWHYQRLRREHLQTTDGQPIRILHPGFWNHEPGPDFRHAVIQFGDALAQDGDVEIDLTTDGWHLHGHDQNSNYKNVVLHVVWETAAQPSGCPAPTLALKSRLDAPVEELAQWLRREPRPAPPNLVGRCSTSLTDLSKQQLSDLLREAAEVRLQTKAEQLGSRAREVGWEQALWEGLFGGLGYKNNSWPMRRIAESIPALGIKELGPLPLQARLLGIANLLPTDSSRPSASRHLGRLWDLWWRERERFADLVLPRSLWRLGALRPANNPQRRLALAAYWLSAVDLPRHLEAWFAAAEPGPKLALSLLKLLQMPEDEFWSRHWTFQSPPLPAAQPWIGPQRVTDLAVNVILPWFWVRARVGQNATLQRRAEECYFAWPRAEDNAVLRLARGRLFGVARPAVTATAAGQQGVLQIVRDFCDYSNALCANCPFPLLLRRGGLGSE